MLLAKLCKFLKAMRLRGEERRGGEEVDGMERGGREGDGIGWRWNRMERGGREGGY